ncbi:LLM class flavin-dependent oxidoreductase [Acuticoccus mangrovi]|uniref:Luciferase-like monooxygenase n=1 Tax=Acuticoccus mangrovi TaxID=2796142 RepID=A0A934IVA3_9HYPH|nr:LLM class flavin-dependent oxidoreductase [Acuticoccus mangrovi]MBJ3778374.1 LLM class flavin-dependent oxidoreductase [Acuticoccus mangrovi]
MIPYSILDLAPITEGSDARTALLNSADLARHAEAAGYTRFWLAEHHNIPGIASAATAVVIGHVAAATKTIRVGSGGIMLPNHAPLIIAEQFGTLACLFPDRIDLGIGRAPGTDMMTARALRRNLESTDNFPQDVFELMTYLDDPEPGMSIKANPGAGTKVPVTILGSSTYGAQLAAYLGLPYAFASHFAPAQLQEALDIYRRTFRPSPQLSAPYFTLAVNVFAADTDEEARYLMSSLQQSFANLRSGRPSLLPYPVDNVAQAIDPRMMATVDEALRVTVVGSADTVRTGLAALLARYRPDEVILTGQIHDHAARIRSFQIAAEVMTSVPEPA